jgi:hypothetical protein
MAASAVLILIGLLFALAAPGSRHFEENPSIELMRK